MAVDVNLLAQFAPNSADLVNNDPEIYVNWLGLKTDANMFNNVANLKGKVMPDLPSGGDGVYGGYYEYASFLTAVKDRADHNRFAAVELGAGWGPWISGAGVVCLREGVRDITLIGVEADKGKCQMMSDHLARNGLAEDDGVKSRVIHGAAWKEDTTLQFPVIDSVRDHGAAATDKSDRVDYRGFSSDFVSVPAFSIETICNGLDLIDYMHWDIQGAELEVAQTSIHFLNEKVSHLFVGTHSRYIEGNLIDLFFRNGWDVLYQLPCAFRYNREKPSLEGMTISDGEIFLRNPSVGVERTSR
ncbi:hypothetical protein RMR10_004720 [Agrobacterium rosae]|uniref:hypothetical protein n=1 Tax=Agrobacterium rosae TaxID=1972867 RepID=UPI002A0E8502|nr:hypothetical protein [Agrobacterium rosae]MDX8315574.1 hypothetical protein [Agrobacterium rosae]